MPIETAIWRIDKGHHPVTMTPLDSERRLEDAITKDLSILRRDLLLLGRQVPTNQGKFIDVLAMDREGNLVIAELKRDRTPREVVAQVLDYASWVKQLSRDQVSALYVEKNLGKELEVGFAEVFGGEPPEDINQSHELVIVCSDLDPSTERIIRYLADNYAVPINAVFFRYYQDGDREYLTRSWLIEPDEAEAKKSNAPGKRTSEPWNGRDYYVSLGEEEHRSWEDCRKYGFISAGGGKWYTQTLASLKPGNRVFVHVPQVGYVGVGIVRDEVVPVGKFEVEVNGRRVPFLKAPRKAQLPQDYTSDPEKMEHVVRVEWLKTVSLEQPYWEKGLFASQHSACRLKNKFTIEKLTQHFGLTE